MSGVSASAARIDRPLYGILAINGTVIVFSSQDAVVKLLSESYSLWQIVCVRSIVASLLIVAVAFFAKGRGASLRSRRPGLQLFRGLLMFASYTLYYLGIVSMPIVDSAALFFSAPLFITLISIPLLGERVGAHRTVAVIIGFIGVLVMLRPGSDGFNVAAVFPLLGAAVYAYCATITRRLGDTESSLAITLYTMVVFGLGSAAGSAIGMALFPGVEGDGLDAMLVRAWTWPTGADLMVLALIGLVAALGHLGISHAYRITQVSIVAPFEYAYLPWVALIGYLVWGEIPASHTLWGIALVVGGGLYVMWREARAPSAGRAA